MLYINENGEGEIQSIIDTPHDSTSNPPHNFVDGQCSNCDEMNRGGDIPLCTGTVIIKGQI
jgi:hypothetical protein